MQQNRRVDAYALISNHNRISLGELVIESIMILATLLPLGIDSRLSLLDTLVNVGNDE